MHHYAVRDDGIIILVAECSEGFGSKIFKRWFLEASIPDDVVERLDRKFVIGGHKAFYIAKLAKKARIFLVSSIPDETVSKVFMEPYRNINDALATAYKTLGKDLKVAVMPFAS